jgi:hypothetical protein
MSTGMIVPGQSRPDLRVMQDFQKSLSNDILKSQMFGCESPSQASILALACLVSGRDPLSLPMEYHLMKGKLTLKAEAMLGRLVRDGGSYQVIEHSPNAAEIMIESRGRKFHQRFTWEEAQQEPFVYTGKSDVIMKALREGKQDTLQISFNYSTPRKRMQMLWSRVVSDGVRVVAPHVLGAYTPEEVSDYSGFALTEKSKSVEVETLVHEPVEEVKHRGTEPTESFEEVVDAVVEQPPVKKITAEQAKQIEQYFALLGMSQAVIDGCLAKRDATLMADLTFDAAADLLIGLKARHDKLAAANPTESGSIAMNSDGPISQELIDKIVGKFKEVAQSDINIVKQLRAKLEKDGVKISELTHNQGRKLLEALDTKQIKSFFDVVLNKNLTVEPIASDDVPDV